MVYSEKDIDFSQISPKEFENLCYNIVVSYGYQNVVWRQGLQGIREEILKQSYLLILHLAKAL